VCVEGVKMDSYWIRMRHAANSRNAGQLTF